MVIKMIHLYTGEGKGKTTAAIGLAVRAAGSGMRAFFTQFMKGNDSGELVSLQQIPEIEIDRSRKNFGFYHAMSESDKAELRAEHNRILDHILEKTASGECGLVVLDEITYPLNWGLLDRERLERVLDARAEIVLTGRDPQQFLIDRADYLTRMEAVRHPYEKGVKARKGIEY